MKFYDYLIKNRNILVFFTCINLFALIVNVLGIKAEYNDACPYVIHNMLCSGEIKNSDLSKGNFWPFVDYYEVVENAWRCPRVQGERASGFRGVFRFYDYSEFFIYSLVLLLLMYVKWDVNSRNKIAFGRYSYSKNKKNPLSILLKPNITIEENPKVKLFIVTWLFIITIIVVLLYDFLSLS
jgi:hypothetical protein